MQRQSTKRWPEALWQLALRTFSHRPGPDWVTLTATREAQMAINNGKLAQLEGPMQLYLGVDSRPNHVARLCADTAAALRAQRLAQRPAAGNPSASGSSGDDEAARNAAGSGGSHFEGGGLYEEVGGDALPGTHCFSSVVAAEVLRLKIGCQVIANSNLCDGDIPNSSRGEVIGFRAADDVKEEDSLDEEGCKRSFNCRKRDIRDWWDQMNQGRQWPVVRFSIVAYDEAAGQLVTTQKIVTVMPRKFEVLDTETGEVIAARMQVPLQLAWALTVSED